MSTGTYIGWDIGGAHLKMAQIDKQGKVISACQIPSPVWMGLDRLNASFTEAKKYFSDNPAYHSITTTAELSDIFSNRRTGLAELVRVISGALKNDAIHFYGGSAGWVDVRHTDQYVHEIASANWHATASFVAAEIGDGILIDIGSTTTDIVPFSQGQLLNQGYTDHERLSCYELVYTGIIRTPVMALAAELPINNKQVPVIPEHFATMSDIYRLLGKLQDEDDMMPTADGKGKSVFESTRRLARMLAIDINEDDPVDKWLEIANYIENVQLNKIIHALVKVLSGLKIKNPVLVGAGAGQFLVKQIAEQINFPYVAFENMLDASEDIKPHAARSATAVAVAQLSRSMF